jgi:hypothetical protein
MIHCQKRVRICPKERKVKMANEDSTHLKAVPTEGKVLRGGLMQRPAKPRPVGVRPLPQGQKPASEK